VSFRIIPRRNRHTDFLVNSRLRARNQLPRQSGSARFKGFDVSETINVP